MLSSWQIAQIHGQQGQQFGAQQQYSQQLSSQMPQPYQGTGLGAQGFQSGFGQGGGYSYGAQGSGYGVGNSFGNRMTSAAGGFGSAVGSAMPIAGAAAGGLMGGVPGAIAGYAFGSIAGGVVNHVSNSFMQGAQEQSSMEHTLSQFQFQNGASRTGKGFNRNDSMQIGNMVRQMERMPEMLTSFGELNRVMDKMGGMGLMNGIRDAGEFSRKFRDTINTLKDLSKVLGGTMEGALQAFAESRQSGFYSKGDIVKNVLARQVTGGLTGMNQSQVAQLQQYGGDVGHATGGSRATGARSITRIAGQLGMANQMGILSNNQIMEMSGKEGAEGIQDIAASMNQLSYKMGNSNVGQALTLALGEMKDGRYTGQMDKSLVEKVRSGQLSLGELKGLARQKASTRGAKLSFAAHKDRLRSEMSGSVGAEGIAMQLNEILGERGWQNPDAQSLVMQRFGASEEQANLLQQMMPNMQSIGSSMSLASRNEQRGAAMNAVHKEHGWDAIKHRIGKKISRYTTDWAKDLGVQVRDYFQNWADDFLDDLSGEYRVNVTQRASDVLSGGGRKAALANARATIGSMGPGRYDIGQSGGASGALARAAHWMSGDESKGERAMSVMRMAGMGSSLVSSGDSSVFDPASGMAQEGLANYYRKKGMTQLDSNTFVQQSKMDKAREYMSSAAFGTDAAARLKEGLGGDVSDLTGAYTATIGEGLTDEADPLKRQRILEQRMLSAYDDKHGDNGGALGAVAGFASKFSLMPGASQMSDSLRKQLSMTRSAAALYGKTGLTGGQMVAGAQELAGKFRGSVDFKELASGTFSEFGDSSASISKKMKELDRDLGKGFGAGGEGAGWAEIKSFIDSGIDNGILVGGNGKQKGLMGDESLRLLMKKPIAEWVEEDKKKIRDMGLDPAKLMAKLATEDGRAQIDKIAKAAAKNSGQADKLNLYLAGGLLQGEAVTKDRYAVRGTAATERLNSDANKDNLGKLAKTASGRSLTALIAKNTGASLDSDNTADVTSALRGASAEETQEGLGLASDEVRDTFAHSKKVQGVLKGKKGGNAQDIISALGGNVDDETRKAIESALGGNKKLDGNDEIEKILRVIDEKYSKGITSKPGADIKSTTVSEQEVANSLKSLGDNNLKMATILGNLANGKSGKDLLEGYNPPKS